MPVPVEIVSESGVSRQLVNPVGKLTMARLTLKQRPNELRLDPDDTILKEATVERGQ
jgi:hypothetical protein